MFTRKPGLPSSPELKAYAALLAVALVWGLHGVFGKSLEAKMDPLSLTVWRYSLTCLCYSLMWWKSFVRILRYDRRTLLQLALAGLLIVVIYPLFFYKSLAYLSPIESLVMMNTSPLLAAMFGYALFRERISLWGWIGIAVSFGGVALLIGGEPAVRMSLAGFGLVGIGAIAFAGYVVLSRKLMATVSLTEMLTGTTAFGVVGLWALALANGSVKDVWTPLVGLSGNGWFELMFIVVFVSVIGYALNGYGTKVLPGGIASAVSLYPQPAFAALFQWLWLGMVPTVWNIASTLLVFGGVALSRYRRRAGAAAARSEAAC